MEIRQRNAKGVLSKLCKDVDSRSLHCTRNRMMMAARIDDALTKLGYTQSQFAKIMGKSDATVSEWLSGDRNFTLDTLSDIEERLGISLLSNFSSSYIRVTSSKLCKQLRDTHQIKLESSRQWNQPLSVKVAPYVSLQAV